MAKIEKDAIEASKAVENRIVGLDGLRGMMTLFVVISHYFGEVGHGVVVLQMGWIAVKMFFALSGFLVGQLILERMDCANFFVVFYVRRVCRTLPVYFFCVALVYFCMHLLGSPQWMDVRTEFPLWSYLTFTQNFFMISSNSIGPHWLAPTWTLSVEEQFYLFAPALFAILPRRLLLGVFACAAFAALFIRAMVFEGGVSTPMTALFMLPGNADSLFAGMFAAVLYKTDGIDLGRHATLLQILPIVALVATFALKIIDGDTGGLTQSLGFFLISVGCAAFILCIVIGTPEARRFDLPALCFFGNTSYSIYLTHLAVLGLMHGLLLGSQPDVADWRQIAVTIAALPVAFFIGWAFTKMVEEPITAYGRTWRWSKEKRISFARVARQTQ